VRVGGDDNFGGSCRVKRSLIYDRPLLGRGEFVWLRVTDDILLHLPRTKNILSKVGKVGERSVSCATLSLGLSSEGGRERLEEQN